MMIKDRLIAAQAEIVRLTHATWCAYCREEFPLDTVSADHISEHIRMCPLHPLHELREWMSRMSKLLRGILERHHDMCPECQEAQAHLVLWERRQG